MTGVKHTVVLVLGCVLFAVALVGCGGGPSEAEKAITYSNRGLASYNLGQYERAIQDYDQAIRLDPQNALAYYGRGLVYKELDKSTEAELDIAKAKELGYDP